MSDDEKGRRSRKAYRRGAENSKSASGWGHFFHETDDFLEKVLPIPDFRNSSQKGEQKAYEAGWHDYEDKKYRYKKRKDKAKRSSSSVSSDSSSSDFSGIVAVIVVVAVIAGGLWIAFNPGKKHNTAQEVWTMRRVKAVNLNIRSAPGVSSSIIATLPRNSRLAVTGQPVSKDGGLWIRVSTDDGGIQGWANQDYVDFGPYTERPETETSVRQEQAAGSDPDSKKSATIPSSSAPLLEVIPYKQTQPSSQSAPTPNPTPRINHSPNIRILSDSPGRPNQLPSTTSVPAQPESADGIPQLKRRPGRPSTDRPESSDGIPRLKRRPE